MSPAVSPERSEQVRSLFRRLVGLTPAERLRRLAHLGPRDAELHGELESLLAAHDRSHQLLGRLDGQLPWLLAAAPAQPPASSVSADPLLGRQVSHYQILERLGGGGMGVVYNARDLRLDRTVALKFLPPHVSLEDDVKQRFIREAQTASALDHPNICTIYDIDEYSSAEGSPTQLFIAMAYYPGETLKKKIERGPLPIFAAIDYATQIARGLAAAHEAGIVHRDIKPANVLVTERAEVKLVDFGIAKVAGEGLTRTGVTLGTVAYMSPEQARGEPVDQRSDLWSLGVVLYEMLTGEPPFRGTHEVAVLYAIEQREPEPLEVLRSEVPPELVRVVQHCLNKDPDERYSSAESLEANLRVVLETIVDPGSPAAEERKGLPHERVTPAPRDAGSAHWQWAAIPNRWSEASPRTRRTYRLWSAVAALLLVSVIIGVALRQPTSARQASADLGSDPTPGVVSLAVLPVVNLSGDPEQEFFADGMTDLLINHLSRISGFDRVISRTSVMLYKGTPKSLRQIGQELGVDVLVEASMLHEGERVRINVGVIEAVTERPLWSESFEHAMRDILALQREVALAIARQIEIALTLQDRERLASAPRVDPEAFDLYVRGTQARYRLTRGFSEARDYFEQAIGRDSTYAPPHTGLAFVHALLGNRDEAERFTQRALELDPNLAETHIAVGSIRQYFEWDWHAAEAAFRQAIRLNPGHAEAHHELSMLLMRLRRFDEALLEAQRTLSLGPRSARFQSGLGEVYLFAGRYEEAVAALEKAVALDPQYEQDAYGWLTLAHAGQQQHQRVLETAARIHEPHPCGHTRACLAYAHAALGNRSEALGIRADMEQWWLAQEGDAGGAGSVGVENKSGTACAYSLAIVHVGLGDHAGALQLLESHATPNHFVWSYLAVGPMFRPLHAEPRFQALLQKMGLPSTTS